MGKGRLEAFSDGVLAIIITIMVLELRAPHESSFGALLPLIPVLLCYVLSFVYVGIYWNNHHHLVNTVEHVSGGIMWANLHLLFWLSLFPFVTAWMGENHFASVPVALYGVVMLMAGCSYLLLQKAIIAAHGPGSLLHKALGRDWKGKASLLLYAAAVACAFRLPGLSLGVYVLVALFWLVPDRRIEQALAASRRR